MKQKMSTQKKITAAVVFVLIAALALGGAYAWTDYSQSALNTFKSSVEADVLLHDDFDGENKDVYVENTGKSDVYVRVKFAEFLQIGNKSIFNAYNNADAKADRSDITTWPVHQFEAADAENECTLSSHTYFTWKMTGNQKAYLAGLTESDSFGRGGLSQEAFEAIGIGDEVTLDDITTVKLNTLGQTAVMMLSDWMALSEEDKSATVCWLLDTDGWAYWSAALEPNTATNLLLDEVVSKEKVPYDNWQYNIDVQMQAATVSEMDNWYLDGDAVAVANPNNSIATTTANGKAFIEYMMNKDIPDNSQQTEDNTDANT